MLQPGPSKPDVGGKPLKYRVKTMALSHFSQILIRVLFDCHTFSYICIDVCRCS